VVVARPEAQQVGSFGPYQYSATTIRPSTHLTFPNSGTCDPFELCGWRGVISPTGRTLVAEPLKTTSAKRI